MSIFDPVYIDHQTDTKLKSLVLNRLDKDKFDDLSSHSPDEIWFIQDSELSGQPIVVDTRPVELPTKLSEFENDVPYLSAVSWSQVTGKPTIPSRTSQLTNDSGYATSAYVDEQIANYSTKWRDWYQTDWAYDGLTFVAESAGATVAMKTMGSAPALSLEYTTDSGTTWSDFIVGTTAVTLANIGDKVGLRAKTTNIKMANSYQNGNIFDLTGSIGAYGDATSLLNKNGGLDTIVEWGLGMLFWDCTSLTHAPELPAKHLGTSAYDTLFTGCSSLREAPELPATDLGSNYCYSQMFKDCTSLTKAPYLPATNLKSNCYLYMFQNCTSLNEIKIAYTGNFSTTYFNNWVNGVAATGTFYYNGSSTSRGVSAIPSGWTIQSF